MQHTRKTVIRSTNLLAKLDIIKLEIIKKFNFILQFLDNLTCIAIFYEI